MLKTSSPRRAASWQESKYTNTAILLHWLIAGLIAVNVVLALSASSVGPEWERFFINLHKSIGLTVLGLVIVRIVWRLRHRPPQFPATMERYAKVAAYLGHVFLYLMMFALPLSGWIHDSAWSAAATHPLKLFGVIPWFRLGFVSGLPPELRDQVHASFGMLHTWLGYALYMLVGIHVLAVIKHQLIDKDNIMRRMTMRRK